MFKKKTPENTMFTGKQILNLIIPLVIEQFFMVTVGMTDSIMTAFFGEDAVSGVSLVDTINVLLINIFAALATGGAVIVGQHIGRNDNKNACKAADQLMIFTTLSSVIIMALIYMFKPFILDVVFGSITPEVKHNSDIYLMIVAASIPFIAVYNGASAVFRSMGNSKIPMTTTLIMNAINVCGNAVLVYIFQIGVAGVAIPTLISRIAGAAIVVALLRKQELPVHISKPFCFKPDFSVIKKILYIGVPNGLENSMFQLGKILVLSLVSVFGTASIAANAVSNAIASFQILPGTAIGLALITVVSQCIGAGRPDQAKYYTKKLMKIAYIAMIATNLLIDLSLPLILYIYNLTPETANLTYEILIYHSVCALLIWPLSFTLPNTLRSAGDVRFCMIISIASMWLCRITLAFVLASWLGMGVMGVWIAMTIDWAVRAAFFIYRYAKGKWQNIKIM